MWPIGEGSANKPDRGKRNNVHKMCPEKPGAREKNMVASPALGKKVGLQDVSTSTSNVGWPLPEGWIWKFFLTLDVDVVTTSDLDIFQTFHDGLGT